MADWITDTTVLSNFAHARRPDLLQAVAATLFVGPEVMRELRRGEASGRVPACDWSWLTVVSLSPTESSRATTFRAAVDSGEAEALAIAEERSLVRLTDDIDARRFAQSRGIMVSGTVGVIKRLFQTQLLSEDEAVALYEVMKHSGFHSPPGSIRSHLR